MDEIEIRDANFAYIQELPKQLKNDTTHDVFRLMTDDEFLERDFEYFLDLKGGFSDFKFDTNEMDEHTIRRTKLEAREHLFQKLIPEDSELRQSFFNPIGHPKMLSHEETTRIVRETPEVFLFLDEHFRADPANQRIAVLKFPELYEYTNPEVRADKKIAVEVFATEPHQIRYAPLEIKNDLKIALACTKADHSTIHLTGPIPEAIYKNAGYGEKGMVALEKAVKAEDLHERLNNSFAPKTETRQKSMKIKI